MKKYTFAICLYKTGGILFAQKKSAINTLSAAMIQKELIAGLLADHFFQVHSGILVIEC